MKSILRLLFTLVYRITYYKLLRRYNAPLSADISRGSKVEPWCKFYSKVEFSGEIGFGSYIGDRSRLFNVRIGRFCSIAPNTVLIFGMHPYRAPYVTTSPCFFSLTKQNGHTFANEQRFDEFKYADGKWNAIIGNDVWIGANVILIAGVNIGDGVVVLAGAVVTHDVPPYAIVGGIPAKVVGLRYDEDTIATLLQMQWWNQPQQWLAQHWELLNDLPALLKYYKKSKEEFTR